MAKAICINGHFYDDERFQECPHCAAGMKPATPSAFAVISEKPREESGREKTGEKRRLFNRRKDHQNKLFLNKGKRGGGTTEDKTQVLTENILESAGKDGMGRKNIGGNSGGYIPESAQDSQAMAYEDNVTQKLDIAYMAEVSEKNRRIPPEEMERGYTEKMPENTMPDKRVEKEYPDREPDRSWEPNVNNADRNMAGASQTTIGQREGRTVGYFSVGIDREPPVGYLICIEGEDYGTGFPLKSGNNSLGRSVSMDVVVMDPKVSREKQAYVMYEPHKRDFFLKPGDSGGLCYLNDELVLEPKKLQAYDLILLGDTKLMLIPVCGEKFSW